MTTESTSPVLSTSCAIAYLGISRSMFNTQILPDPTFPKSFKLGMRSRFWLRADIENWLHDRAAAANAQVAA